MRNRYQIYEDQGLIYVVDTVKEKSLKTFKNIQKAEELMQILNWRESIA